MRIACIAGTDLRTDRRARAHARALGLAGHEVTLFGIQSRGAEPEEEDGPVVLVRTPLPGWRRHRGGDGDGGSAGGAWRLARWVRRYEPVVHAALSRGGFDAFHAFGIDVAGPTAQEALRAGARFVYDDAGVGRLDLVARRAAELPLGARRGAADLVLAYLRLGEERLQRTVRAAADVVIAASSPLGDDGRSRWGGPPAVVVRDAFVAPARRKAERLRTRLGVYPEDRVVVLRDADGADAAVRALPILGPNHVLVLLGWSRSAAHAMAVAEIEGVSERVRVVPPAPESEIVELLSSADAAIVPVGRLDRPKRLSLPRSIFEALAAAVPIVAPDIPALGELVRQTGAGVLYPGREPADPGALAEALRTVLDDRSLAAACRDRARAVIVEDLSWERESERLLDAYRTLAATV